MPTILEPLDMPTISHVLGTFSGKIFARCEDGYLWSAPLEPILPIAEEFAGDPKWVARKALTQATLFPQHVQWTESEADSENSIRFDAEARMLTREKLNW